MEKIKLLVVDDSILFREVLTRYIKLDDMIEVVGKASDAYSARDLILEHEPDVMVLDLELPRMNGAEFLQKLLPQYYIPTIIVSSTNSDSRKADCIKAGAVEFLTKPSSSTNSQMMMFADALGKAVHRAYNKTKHSTENKAPAAQPAAQTPRPAQPAAQTPRPTQPAAQTPRPTQPMTQAAPTASTAAPKPNPAPTAAKPPASNTTFTTAASAAATAKTIASAAPKTTPNPPPTMSSGKHAKLKKTEAIIALGASTGGTEALEKVIKNFPPDTPPVIIVQHMPAGFTKLYSERLNRSCQMRVKEAQDGDRLERGLIIVGAGEYHLRLCRDARGWYVSSKPGEKVSGHCPSVDVMFNSVADVAGPLAIGAILTGMGRDGADGLLRMRQNGAFTVGQDKETCVVYGMPMEAYNCGAVEVQAPLQKIADIILNQLY